MTRAFIASVALALFGLSAGVAQAQTDVLFASGLEEPRAFPRVDGVPVAVLTDSNPQAVFRATAVRADGTPAPNALVFWRTASASPFTAVAEPNGSVRVTRPAGVLEQRQLRVVVFEGGETVEVPAATVVGASLRPSVIFLADTAIVSGTPTTITVNATAPAAIAVGSIVFTNGEWGVLDRVTAVVAQGANRVLTLSPVGFGDVYAAGRFDFVGESTEVVDTISLLSAPEAATCSGGLSGNISFNAPSLKVRPSSSTLAPSGALSGARIAIEGELVISGSASGLNISGVAVGECSIAVPTQTVRTWLYGMPLQLTPRIRVGVEVSGSGAALINGSAAFSYRIPFGMGVQVNPATGEWTPIWRDPSPSGSFTISQNEAVVSTFTLRPVVFIDGALSAGLFSLRRSSADDLVEASALRAEAGLRIQSPTVTDVLSPDYVGPTIDGVVDLDATPRLTALGPAANLLRRLGFPTVVTGPAASLGYARSLTPAINALIATATPTDPAPVVGGGANLSATVRSTLGVSGRVEFLVRRTDAGDAAPLAQTGLSVVAAGTPPPTVRWTPAGSVTAGAYEFRGLWRTAGWPGSTYPFATAGVRRLVHFGPVLTVSGWAPASTALRDCVRRDYALATPLSQVTRVICQNANVTSLSGIEALTGLLELYIDGNPIVSIAPLAPLAQLSTLVISNTLVSNPSQLQALRQLNELLASGVVLEGDLDIDRWPRLQRLVLPSTTGRITLTGYQAHRSEAPAFTFLILPSAQSVRIADAPWLDLLFDSSMGSIREFVEVENAPRLRGVSLSSQALGNTYSRLAFRATPALNYLDASGRGLTNLRLLELPPTIEDIAILPPSISESLRVAQGLPVLNTLPRLREGYVITSSMYPCAEYNTVRTSVLARAPRFIFNGGPSCPSNGAFPATDPTSDATAIAEHRRQSAREQDARELITPLSQ